MTFIDPRGKVFRHLDRLAGWQAGARPAPVTVEWDLSNRCSLGCQDCHFAHTHSRGPWASKFRVLPSDFSSTGDLADAALVTRTIQELSRLGVKGIVWSGGGEPTLHPAWEYFVREAARAGLQQGMYTLGGHLTADSAATLADTAAFVVVSLDAADAETYSDEKGVAQGRFADACQGIRWLAEAEGSAVIGVSFLLHAGNWRRAWAMYRLALELGATYAAFRPAIQFSPDAPVMPTGDRRWIAEAMPTLEGLSRSPRVEIDVQRFADYATWQGHGYSDCRGIRLNATITPDGRVWVCPNRRGVAGSDLGDLRRETFADLWARHPGHFDVNAQCRVMCRLHAVNQTIAAIEKPQAHEAFV